MVFHGFDLLRREEDGGIGLLIEEEDLDCGHDHRDHHDPEDGDADAEVLPHLHCTRDHLDHLDHDDHHYHLVLVPLKLRVSSSRAPGGRGTAGLEIKHGVQDLSRVRISR